MSRPAAWRERRIVISIADTVCQPNTVNGLLDELVFGVAAGGYADLPGKPG